MSGGGRLNLYYSLETKALEAATTKHRLTTRGRNRIYSGAIFVIVSFCYMIITIIRPPTMDLYLYYFFHDSHVDNMMLLFDEYTFKNDYSNTRRKFNTYNLDS